MTITINQAKRISIFFGIKYPETRKVALILAPKVEDIYGPNSGLNPNLKGGYILKPITLGGVTYDAQIGIPTNNATDAADFSRTLQHEFFGHHGINTFTNNEKDALLKGILSASNQPSMKLLWDEINRSKDYINYSGKAKAEEVFALHCEKMIHTKDHNAIARGEKALLESCVHLIRTMELTDLNNIAQMVAQGMHDQTRKQQIFYVSSNVRPRSGDNLMESETKKPFYEIVAENLIKQLQEGTAPWQKPWEPGAVGFMPINHTTNKRYKGVNTIHLMSQGYGDNRWMTYNQAQSIGAQVRKGEKGTQIQHWKFTEEQTKLDEKGKPVLDDKGKPVKEEVRLDRPRVFFSTVFNAQQIDGLPPLPPMEEEKSQRWDAIERAENILQASNAKLQHGEHDRAFYRPSTDSIHLPNKEQFPSAGNYYATALHELGHWTGHKSRLDRDLIHPFGSEGYAKEELRAECFSLIMGDELGIGHDPGQHAAYVKSWIKVLQDDPKEIFRATADAEKIASYVLAFEQQQELDQNQKVEPMLSDEHEVVSLQRQYQTDGNRTYIDVPFSEKNEAKALGAKWDKQERSWFIPSGVEISSFAKWTQHEQPAQASQEMGMQIPNNSNLQTTDQDTKEKIYLAVPYTERTEAKALGAKWDKDAKSWYVTDNVNLDKLSKWLPDHVNSMQNPAMSPREEFSQALQSIGFVLDGGHPFMDGKKHRVPTEGDKKGEKAGFYVGYLDGHPAGFMSNNRTGVSMNWKSKGFTIEPAERAKLQAEAAQKKIDREVELNKTQEATAQRITSKIETLLPATEQTPYMINKGIQAHSGVLTDVHKKTTYIPGADVNGKVWTMQYINEDGSKRFAKDSKKEGCFHIVGGDMDALKSVPVLAIQEGYATAATIAETLNFATVAAFDSGNLQNVAVALHAKFPDKPIMIFADNDKHQELMQGTNPGKTKAEEAAALVGGQVIMPIFAKDEANYPTNLAPITPQNYKEHARALKTLETAPAQEKSNLEKSLLSKQQLSALSNMKKYTDFNDLATKSIFGREGVERQVKSAVNKVLKDAGERKHEQKLTEKEKLTHKQKRSARINTH